jgi:uracil-DNA glycosylase
MPNLRAILAIGGFAHDAAIISLGLKKSAFPFAHGALHRLTPWITMVDSYHCSRLNTNTGRLTAEMFAKVVDAAIARLA